MRKCTKCDREYAPIKEYSYTIKDHTEYGNDPLVVWTHTNNPYASSSLMASIPRYVVQSLGDGITDLCPNCLRAHLSDLNNLSKFYQGTYYNFDGTLKNTLELVDIEISVWDE